MYTEMEDHNTRVFFRLLLVLLIFVRNTLQSYQFTRYSGDESKFDLFIDTEIKENAKLHRFIRSLENSNANPSYNASNAIHGKLSSSTFFLPDLNHTQAVVSWSGKNSSVVFVLTRQSRSGFIVDSTLWRSTDYGTSFTKVNIRVEDPSIHVVIKFIYVSRLNKNKIILTDVTNLRIYVTENEGNTWNTTLLNYEPDELLLHPTEENWLLGYSFFDMRLFVSSDFGKSWTLFHEDVSPKFFWDNGGRHEDRFIVHMEIQDLFVTESCEYIACTAPKCIDVTPDKTIGFIDPLSLQVQNQYAFITKSTIDSTVLYVSHNRSVFKPAYFPLDVHPKDFKILNTDQNQVFMAADHEENLVTLYSSDPTGQFYIPVLKNVVATAKPGWFDVDLYEVRGIPATYIANKYAGKHDSTFVEQKTYISFDKGKKWSLIPVPSYMKSQCEDQNDCSLHLHLDNSNTYYNIPRAVSKKEAPGLILAHGVIGKGLTPHKTSVFVSPDGGLTWNPTPFSGNYYLNILDQGGAITAIKSNHSELTNVVHFSCDEGATWQKHIFSDNLIYVDGVLNDPGISTLVISVFGRLKDKLGRLMVKLNFSSILTQKCSESDYITWKPPTKISNSSCILGKTYTYQRRKQNSVCYNGIHYNRLVEQSKCLCTGEDYECDYGYEGDGSGNCVKALWFDTSKIAWHCSEGESHQVSQGYRKIASDSCVGGVENSGKYSLVTKACSVTRPEGLLLSLPISVLTKAENITFSLTQQKGSVLSTKYIWDFGDGSPIETDIGLVNAAKKNHVFSKAGRFTVKVTAVNSEGSSSCTITVPVEAKLIHFTVEYPWGTHVGKPTHFNITLLGEDDPREYGPVHYAWFFGDEPTGSHPYLTWSYSVTHTYKAVGIYNVTVEAVNRVGTVVKKLAVHVYPNTTTLRLHFSKNMDHFNSGSIHWRMDTSYLIANSLKELLYVGEKRLIVSIPPGKPTVADVTIVPSPSGGGLTVSQVVSELWDKLHAKQLAISLLTDDDYVQITQIQLVNETGDIIFPDTTPTPSPHTNSVTSNKKPSNTALMVAVPLVILSIIIILAVVIVYFKRKYKQKKRYALITNRVPGSTMFDDDEYDDDYDEETMGVGRLDDNDDAYQDGGTNIVIDTAHNPHLVIMTSTHNNEDLNVENC